MDRELSVQRDRLLGIAGLAKEFERVTKSPTDAPNDEQYFRGFWKKDFIRGLCWNGYRARIQQSNLIQLKGPSLNISDHAGHG